MAAQLEPNVAWLVELMREYLYEHCTLEMILEFLQKDAFGHDPNDICAALNHHQWQAAIDVDWRGNGVRIVVNERYRYQDDPEDEFRTRQYEHIWVPKMGRLVI